VVPLGRYRAGPLPRNQVVPFQRNQGGPLARNPARALMLGDGTVKLLPGQAPGAKQIADARYDAAAERLLMSFRDSTMTNVNVRP
jgi:hypothetical protein